MEKNIYVAATWSLPKQGDNAGPHKNLRLNAHRGFTRNCPNLEATKMASVAERIHRVVPRPWNIITDNKK